MKQLTLVTAALLITIFYSCNQSAKKKAGADNTVSTEKFITYSGTLPCADCGGILTQLTITSPDSIVHHFKMTETYQGLNNKGDQEFNSEGIYIVTKGSASDPNAVIITLNPDKDKNLQRYFQKISEDELRMLDVDQKAIPSNLNYTLKKQ
ncbi:MAG: copper resistance protein NlpE N-terminal domain-containing protein [Chitinophaga sp.]|uniref:copper resistance protein NlpE n=1 Tax=Chitinophaga sp. TaxID=1869181 RepID=UPI0025BEB531|nr:copper resistance protein NlpE [Chitinophaga sp.]MBV8254779.1 copper resistance protein NlpE N-terminal domain-containing protein [Chitinophaga sp.]